MVKPEFLLGSGWQQSLPGLSVFVAMLGALGAAIAYVMVRKLSQTEDSSVIIFYFPLIDIVLRYKSATAVECEYFS